MRSSKYSRDVLAPLVSSSRSISEVIRKLGLERTGGNYRHINARIRLAGLDTSHFTYGKSGLHSLGISRDVLVGLVNECTSVAQVLVRLGLPTEGRPHHELSRELRTLQIDTSHFTGPGWARGHTVDTHPSVRKVWQTKRLTDDEVFVENGRPMSGPGLVRRLVAMGWPYRCAWCEISEWRGERLVLHLDHINGINNDHRLVNLRLLCPNCHSQTPTYCNRRR